jgi:hypothetical protein
MHSERETPDNLVSETRTHVCEGSARAFQRDLFFYWSTVRAQPLSLTKQDRLYRKDLRRVNAALLQPEELIGVEGTASSAKDEFDLPRLTYLRFLLTDMGQLRREGQTIHATEQPTFLEAEPAHRIRYAFARWREGTFWNEVLSIPHITVKEAGTRADPAPTAIVRARGSVLDYIAEHHQASIQRMSGEPGSASEGHWLSIQHLIDHVRRVDYGYLLPRSDALALHAQQVGAYRAYLSYRSPYIGYGNEMGWNFSPPFADEDEGWDVVETGFIRALLVEPLYWMGLVDIGYVDDAPAAYRLTPVGAWVLGVGPRVDIPEGEGRVIVQPNFEILALDPVSDRTLATLDEFTERISAERAIKYRLTRESVYRGQRRGWTTARIIQTLEDTQNRPLPQNVARTLSEWQVLHERITIHRRVNLLQAVDAALLGQLMGVEAIRTHVVVPKGPRPTAGASPPRAENGGQTPVPETHAAATLIAPGLGRTEELVRALQRAGYPPARTWYRGVAAPRFTPVKGIEIDDDGRVRFAIALPSISVLERLAPFTSRDGHSATDPSAVLDAHSQYTLTQPAVQGAIKQGMTVDEILHHLRTLHRGPLPRWVEIRVRAWGHHYGEASVQTVTLVQLRDDRTLDELLAEPEFEGILRRFTPDESKALALVSTSDLSRLYEFLAERGIEIDDQLD